MRVLTFSSISVLWKSLTLDEHREWVTTIIWAMYFSNLNSIINKIIMENLNLKTSVRKYFLSTKKNFLTVSEFRDSKYVLLVVRNL